MNEKHKKMSRYLHAILGLFLVTGFIARPAGAQSDYKLVEQDSLALVAFYHATDGPNWTSNQDGFGIDDLSTEWQGIYSGGYNHWLDGPVKDWFGVRVEKRPIVNSSDSAYRVTWLWPVIGRRTDGQNRLRGSIPREVGLLTAMEYFRIQGNDGFRWSEIPDDLYVKSLKYMDIEACWFGGGISDAFRNCTQIQKMNFRYNYIDYMPALDFLDADGLYNLEGTQWWYSTRLSYAIIEKSIDHFYTVSPNLKEFQIEARDLFDVGDEQEVVAALGSAVELECTAAGEQEERITYQWFKNGLSMFGKTSRKLSISSVKESDYAEYTVKITNEYVKEYDQNSNYGEVVTKPIHLVAEPVPPVLESVQSSYNGKELILRMSKPMDASAAGFEGFSIRTGDRNLVATGARTSGRLNLDLVLSLSEALVPEDVVSLDYSGTGVVDGNGGILASFADTSVVNQVREAPALVEARTTRDGSGILAIFDKYIDPQSIDPGEFIVGRDGNGEISGSSLWAGDLDKHISKTVFLALSDPITDSAEVLTVQYLGGQLCGLYSGVAAASEETDVQNQVSVDLTDVLLGFEDGSRSLEGVVVKISGRLEPVRMYDDGTHGDTIAEDHNWATTVSLVDDTYSWEVLSRETRQSYDTITTVDPETGIITKILTPVEINNDSLLSEGALLEFHVAANEVTGTTTYGIMNLDVSFQLTVAFDTEEVFLMGIEGDWSLGIPMTAKGVSNEYITTVSGYSPGDVIEYNYRAGDQWENQSAGPRTYTVTSGENLVKDAFGQFTGSFDSRREAEVLIYPNPAGDILQIRGLEGYFRMEVYGPAGRLCQSELLDGSGSWSSDISGLDSGIYLVRLYNEHNKETYLKFIKY